MSFPNPLEILPYNIHGETERLDLFGQDSVADLLNLKQAFRRILEQPFRRRGHYLRDHCENGGKVPQELPCPESKASFIFHNPTDKKTAVTKKSS